MCKILKLKFQFFLFFPVFYFLFIATAAQAADLYFSPSSGSYRTGTTLSIAVYATSEEQAMNAVSGIITFSKDKIEITSLSKDGSILNLWVQEPSFSNEAGKVNFEGIALNPGFTGKAGKLITINFKTKGTGDASFTFSSAQVLANDGKGTGILKNLGVASLILSSSLSTPVASPNLSPRPTSEPTLDATEIPEVFSLTHPDSERWYSNNSPEFNWNLPSDATGVSVALNQRPLADPGSVSDGKIQSKKYENVGDGVWYFHIKFQGRFGWGNILHRKVLIDREPPKPFEIKVDNGDDSTNPSPILYFNSQDHISGIEYYEIKIGEGNAIPRTAAAVEHNPFKMPPQAPGKHTIIVKAVDRAGNGTVAATEINIEPITAPMIVKFPKEAMTGNILAIEGTCLHTDAKISVFTKKEGEEIEKGIVNTDNRGNWTFVYPRSLSRGVYQVWAQVEDNRGAISRQTEKITIPVNLPPFLKFGRIVIDYISVMISLIALIIVLILIITYSRHRFVLLQNAVKKETKDVAQSVTKAFRALREEVEEQINTLDKRKKLSRKEKEVRDNLKEALDISEKYIAKEIKDVEKKIENPSK